MKEELFQWRNEGIIKIPNFEWDSPIVNEDKNGWKAVYESIKQNGWNRKGKTAILKLNLEKQIIERITSSNYRDTLIDNIQVLKAFITESKFDGIP